MDVVFCDGQYLPGEELKLPYNDRGLLFGDGVFTTIRVNNGRIEYVERHLKRLQENCSALNIECPAINPEWLTGLVNRNKALSGVWRLKVIITGGESPQLDLSPRQHGHVIITLSPYKTIPPIPYKVTVCASSVQSPLAHIKSLSYLDRLWVMDFAKKENCHDAITTAEGVLLEAAFSNIFWRHGQNIYTPGSHLSLLPGISLSVIKEGAQSLEMNVHEVEAILDDIPLDSQPFICNSMVGFHPIERILDKSFSRDVKWEARLKKTC